MSQSALRVGSQEVAWIWDKRPPPANPATPRPTPGRGEDVCTIGDTATTGDAEPVVNVFPYPVVEEVTTADIGDTTAARPPSAAVVGEGEAEFGLGCAPLAAGCPPGKLAKVGGGKAPLPCPGTPKLWALPLYSSPKLSAITYELTS